MAAARLAANLSTDAAHKPERLIIFDIYENNAYDIQQELKMKYPNLKLTVLIGSIRDEERVDTVLGSIDRISFITLLHTNMCH